MGEFKTCEIWRDMPLIYFAAWTNAPEREKSHKKILQTFGRNFFDEKRVRRNVKNKIIKHPGGDVLFFLHITQKYSTKLQNVIYYYIILA